LYIPLLIILFIKVSVIGGPLSSLGLYFGEEYGWRGFLQNELFRYNKIFGAAFIGFIWGLWHIPLIMRGMHTYPNDMTGIIAGLVLFTLWGIIMSYSVLKTDSIWVAAFLHGSVNYIYNFSITYVVHPYNNLKSFGLGIYGILILLVIVFVIFFDPLWKSRKNTVHVNR
jgi:membrane protease YdiL (CAAX protease family)